MAELTLPLGLKNRRTFLRKESSIGTELISSFAMFSSISAFVRSALHYNSFVLILR